MKFQEFVRDLVREMDWGGGKLYRGEGVPRLFSVGGPPPRLFSPPTPLAFSGSQHFVMRRKRSLTHEHSQWMENAHGDGHESVQENVHENAFEAAFVRQKASTVSLHAKSTHENVYTKGFVVIRLVCLHLFFFSDLFEETIRENSVYKHRDC